MKKIRPSPAVVTLIPRVPARQRVVMAGKLLPLHRLPSVVPRKTKLLPL